MTSIEAGQEGVGTEEKLVKMERRSDVAKDDKERKVTGEEGTDWIVG